MKKLYFLIMCWLSATNVRAEIAPLLIKLNCQICHQPIASANLQKKSPEKILTDLKNFKTGKRPSLIMHRLVKGLTDIELRQVATLMGQEHGN